MLHSCELNRLCMAQGFGSFCVVVSVGLPFATLVMEQAYLKRQFSGTKCHLASALIDCAVWGLMHWSIVQKLALAQCKDNEAMGVFTHPDLCDLARLGCSGAYSGNIRRDAMSKIKALPGVVEAQLISVPCFATKSLNRLEAMMVDVPIILPNLLLESLYQHFPNKFRAALGPGLRQFWDKVNPADPRLVTIR